MEYITIGIVGKAHGIKGEVIVHPMTFDPNRFFELKTVYITKPSHQKLTIEHIKEHKNSFRIKFSESIDRNFAESIRNAELQIPESESIDLPDDVHFVHDLEGCMVFNRSHNKVGTVIRIQESPMYDMFVVKTEKKEILIPNISQFVQTVDIEKKEIYITEIPGLIDL